MNQGNPEGTEERNHRIGERRTKVRNHKIIFKVFLLLLTLQIVPPLSYAGALKYLVLDGKKVILNVTKENVKAMFPEADYMLAGEG